MFRTAFCIGIFNSKNLPIFLLRRFIPFFHYTTIHPGSQRFPADGNHPRLCGEKRFAPASSSLVRGSPPPMRGKVVRGQRCQQVIGITPAYAGKRHRFRIPALLSRDHPRLCGEKFQSVHRWTFFIGSPPPMRGKVNRTSEKPVPARITPAYAGKRGSLRIE